MSEAHSFHPWQVYCSSWNNCRWGTPAMSHWLSIEMWKHPAFESSVPFGVRIFLLANLTIGLILSDNLIEMLLNWIFVNKLHEASLHSSVSKDITSLSYELCPVWFLACPWMYMSHSAIVYPTCILYSSLTFNLAWQLFYMGKSACKVYDLVGWSQHMCSVCLDTATPGTLVESAGWSDRLL